MALNITNMQILDIKQMLAKGINSIIDLNKQIVSRCDRYVFSYHRILNVEQASMEGVHHSLWLTPERFEAQIKWMRSVGEIVEYSRLLDNAIPNDKPLFALTFDDGWKDNYNYAFPILRKYKVPAVVFLVTDAVERDALFWPQDIATKTKRILDSGLEDRVRTSLYNCSPEKHIQTFYKAKKVSMDLIDLWIESLKKVGTIERKQRISDYFQMTGISSKPLSGYIMSWSDVKEMVDGGIKFGSHTHNHTILKGLQNEEITYELKHSKRILSDRLQMEIDSFCYPNGRFNGSEGEILSRCGYCYGFRLDNMPMSRCSDFHYIPRFLVSQRNTDSQSYFRLRLLEAPFFRTKPHNPNSEDA